MSTNNEQNNPSLEPIQNADYYKSKGDPTKHDMTVDRSKEHISQKVYMMPEVFNKLREELVTFWPNLWNQVQGYMAFDAPRFCYAMDGALDLITQFDSGNVDGICARYLDALREKRGLKPLHSPSVYFANRGMEENIRLARYVHENLSPVATNKLTLPAFPTSKRQNTDIPIEPPSPMDNEDE